MLSNISAERLAQVHPELARRVRNLATALEAENIQIQVSMGLRTAAQQTEIYAQGRTEPGKVVTNAHDYQSNHVIGCAVDVYPEDAETNAPDWNATHPSWQRIIALAPTYGLRDGKSWHDLPHLEFQEIPTEPTPAVQECCKLNGVTAVWALLDIPTLDSEPKPPGAVSA